MAKRRMLRGKKLLVAAGLATATVFSGCDDAVANLILPPTEDASTDAPADTGSDAAEDAVEDVVMDAPLQDLPVANLILPPDSGEDGR